MSEGSLGRWLNAWRVEVARREAAESEAFNLRSQLAASQQALRAHVESCDCQPYCEACTASKKLLGLVYSWDKPATLDATPTPDQKAALQRLVDDAQEMGEYTATVRCPNCKSEIEPIPDNPGAWRCTDHQCNLSGRDATPTQPEPTPCMCNFTGTNGGKVSPYCRLHAATQTSEEGKG